MQKKKTKHVSKRVGDVSSIVVSDQRLLPYHALLGQEAKPCSQKLRRVVAKAWSISVWSKVSTRKLKTYFQAFSERFQNILACKHMFWSHVCGGMQNARYAIYCFANCSIVFSGRAWLIYRDGCCGSTLPLSGGFVPLHPQKPHVGFPNLGDIRMVY